MANRCCNGSERLEFAGSVRPLKQVPAVKKTKYSLIFIFIFHLSSFNFSVLKRECRQTGKAARVAGRPGDILT